MPMPFPGEGRWRIDDVLDRTDLAVLLDELAQPTGRMGPSRRWHCPAPNHDDHRASVSMFRDRLGHERWRCWSADHRGDAVDLVMTVTGRTRGDAVDWLAGRAGMTPDRPLPPPRPKATPPRPAAAVVMDPAVERYVAVSERILWHSRHGRAVHDWLHGRGFDDELIRANRLGADPGRTVISRRRGLPFGAGPAATFPALDPAGNVTYVQARYLDPDGAGRKYDNPSASLAPHPRVGFAVTNGDTGSGPLLVCEGLPDALTAARAGYPSVALLGAQTPNEAVAARIANHAAKQGLEVALVCDPDAAGRRVADILVPLLGRLGSEPLVVVPPEGLDLNAWATADPSWADDLAMRCRVVQRNSHAQLIGMEVP